MANNNLNLIIDECVWDFEQIYKYQIALAHHQIVFVKIACSRKVAQQREILRGDREIGLANAQYDSINMMQFDYDLSINTDDTNVFDTADFILNTLNLKI